MKTIDIKGKEYIQVNERIMYFWREFIGDKQGQIVTTLLSMEDGVCVFRADIIIDGTIVATGHAYEKEGSTFINKTSYVENCETSAVGRALGILGIGIDTSIASAEEVQNAIKQQNDDKVPLSDKKAETLTNSFKGQISQHNSSKSLDAWAKQNANKIKNNLPEDKIAEVRNHLASKKEVLLEAEKKNKSILDSDLPV